MPCRSRDCVVAPTVVSLPGQDTSRRAVSAGGTLGVRLRAAHPTCGTDIPTRPLAHRRPHARRREPRGRTFRSAAPPPCRQHLSGGMHHDEHQDRRGHHRRRPVRPLPGLRAGAARDPCACRGHAVGDRRAVRRALPGKADLRHPGVAGGGRPRTRRTSRPADPAVRTRSPPGRDGGEARTRARWFVRAGDVGRNPVSRPRGGDRGRARLLSATAAPHPPA